MIAYSMPTPPATPATTLVFGLSDWIVFSVRGVPAIGRAGVLKLAYPFKPVTAVGVPARVAL